MTTDLTALRAALAKHPDDVTARLVAADALQEADEESAWQDYLDQFPDHHEVRLRFGVWLAERSDPRAEGMRAMGLRGLHPWFSEGSRLWVFWNAPVYQESLRHPIVRAKHTEETRPSMLPGDWFGAASGNERLSFFRRSTRRGIEDDVAHAFAELAPNRRAWLLRALTGATP
jgi:uncharacterized protein (TIGR02996 family)